MFILNIEDDIYKHHDICTVLKRGGFSSLQIDCEENLEGGMNRIKKQIESGKPYDLIITDMWYPECPGGMEKESGVKLIHAVKENRWDIPIILCSSVRYRTSCILGCVHYSENEDWESEIIRLAKQAI